jgi:hypothetical protein
MICKISRYKRQGRNCYALLHTHTNRDIGINVGSFVTRASLEDKENLEKGRNEIKRYVKDDIRR